jgi:hypothetical protein
MMSSSPADIFDIVGANTFWEVVAREIPGLLP